MLYERRIIALLLLVVLVFFFSGCVSGTAVTNKTICVKFFGGEANSVAMIILPSNEIVLIDGGQSQQTRTKITETLESENVDKIDYLFVTLPLDRCVENALQLSSVYDISVIYRLRMKNTEIFERYNRMVSVADKEQKFAEIGETIEGENYFMAVLSPDTTFNSSVFSNEDVAKISPIIYLDYNGVRFLFLGESDYSSQTRLAENYLSGVFDLFYPKEEKRVNLRNIDFVHISSNNPKEISVDLLEILNAKNTVVSTSYNSYEQNISTTLVSKIYEMSENVNIWQCSLKNLTVSIDNFSKTEIVFE